MVKVIASSVRKGNVLDLDGKLCVVMKAENIHPGKGTPVTHLDMRRIADGVKITERYRTTDQVERAYLEEQDLQLSVTRTTRASHFMEPETFEQIMRAQGYRSATRRSYLQENMAVNISLHEGVPIAVELPQRVTLRGHGSRPGRQGPDRLLVLQAGHALQRPRVMVPPHIQAGTRVVIMTEDGSYVERAKD